MKHRTTHLRIVGTIAALATSFALSGAPMATTAASEIEKRLYADADPGTIGIVTCDLDDSFEIPAKQITRVAVDDASVLQVAAVEGGSALRITCKKEGTSIMTVTKSGTDFSVAVNIPRPVAPESTQSGAN